MAVEVFKLFGSIFVDNEKANESIAKTDDKASKVAENFAKGAKTAAKWGGAILAGATTAVGGAISLAKSTAEMTDEIDKASIRMGVSAESYQELSYAAGQCGVEMSVMEKAAKALEGTDLSMDDAMAQIMELSTAEERSAKAAELFGETVAYKMSPLIEQSTDSYDGLIDRAHELGLVMSDEAVSNGVEFGDLLSDLSQSAQRLGGAIGAELFPILNDTITMIIDMMPTIQGIFNELAPVISDTVSKLIPPLMDLAQAILPIVADLVTQLVPIIAELLTALTPIITDFLGILMPIIQPILEIVMDLLNIVLPPLTAVIKALSETIIGELGAAFESISPLLEDFEGILDGIINFVKNVFAGNWSAAWDSVVQIFSSIFNGIGDAAKIPLNFVIGLINKVFARLGSIDIPDWVPGIGGKTFSLPQIPLLAKGGSISSSGAAIVGEAGAELIEMPTGARVTPLDSDGRFVEKMDKVLSLLEEYLPNMCGDVVLDSGALVGKLTPAIDKNLGRRASIGALR